VPVQDGSGPVEVDDWVEELVLAFEEALDVVGIDEVPETTEIFVSLWMQELIISEMMTLTNFGASRGSTWDNWDVCQSLNAGINYFRDDDTYQLWC